MESISSPNIKNRNNSNSNSLLLIKLKQKTTLLNALLSRYKEAEAVINTLMNEKSNFSIEIEKYKEKCNKLEASVKGLESYKDQLEADISGRGKKNSLVLDSFEEKISKLVGENLYLKNINTDLNKLLKEKEKENKELKKSLNEKKLDIKVNNENKRRKIDNDKLSLTRGLQLNQSLLPFKSLNSNIDNNNSSKSKYDNDNNNLIHSTNRFDILFSDLATNSTNYIFCNIMWELIYFDLESRNNEKSYLYDYYISNDVIVDRIKIYCDDLLRNPKELSENIMLFLSHVGNNSNLTGFFSNDMINSINTYISRKSNSISFNSEGSYYYERLVNVLVALCKENEKLLDFVISDLSDSIIDTNLEFPGPKTLTQKSIWILLLSRIYFSLHHNLELHPDQAKSLCFHVITSYHVPKDKNSEYFSLFLLSFMCSAAEEFPECFRYKYKSGNPGELFNRTLEQIESGKPGELINSTLEQIVYILDESRQLSLANMYHSLINSNAPIQVGEVKEVLFRIFVFESGKDIPESKPFENSFQQPFYRTAIQMEVLYSITLICWLNDIEFLFDQVLEELIFHDILDSESTKNHYLSFRAIGVICKPMIKRFNKENEKVFLDILEHALIETLKKDSNETNFKTRREFLVHSFVSKIGIVESLLDLIDYYDFSLQVLDWYNNLNISQLNVLPFDLRNTLESLKIKNKG